MRQNENFEQDVEVMKAVRSPSVQSSEWTDVFTDGVSDEVIVKQLQPHKEYRFNCKAVCRPGVSLTSETTSIFKTRPCAPPGAPIVKRVESESAIVAWDVPTSVGEDVLVTGYVLEFRERRKDQESEKPWKSVKSTNREYTLQGLKEDTIYTIRVFANCGNDGESLFSPETVFSASFKGKQSNKDGKIPTPNSYRFKLINEVTNRSQAESQTYNVSSHELYNQPGFQVPYTLTIVDTPGFGDTRGIPQDKLITEQVKSFLCNPLGIDHIDAVCFVVQASLPRLSANQKYIFNSILSIFGKDIAENIIILVTFADGRKIPVLEAIKAADLPCQKNNKGQPTHFSFNNSAVYADKKVEKPTTSDNDSDDNNDEDDKLTELVWDKTFKQMKAFFKTLGAIESKDLTMTIKVLEERERLEKAMKSLTPQITAGLSKISEIKNLKQCLGNESENMDQNKDLEQDVEVVKAIRSPVNCFTMNCNTCFFTSLQLFPPSRRFCAKLCCDRGWQLHYLP
ncbi:uncharacterized protein LOC143731145 [Siphateles boraxobius]|uniref:uncharacterized protein LOC143731145 n=1 Tax=Siphateles boraxobius TaxID=180520 RepID=UPI004062D48C